MILWWGWLLLWGAVVVGGLLLAAYSVIFLVRKGTGTLDEFAEAFGALDDVSAEGAPPQPDQEQHSSPVASIVEGWVKDPWRSYYKDYYLGKKTRQRRRRRIRMLTNRNAGRPQRIRDIQKTESEFRL